MHPYSQLPNRNFWRRFVPERPWRDLEFKDTPKFRLSADDKIATAGSCFAQHISKHMRKVGLNPFIAETAHPLVSEYGDSEYLESYALFSARYGNIYTARQCLELFQQAFSLRPMIYDFAQDKGRWFDLLRPNVPNNGFATSLEAEADRAYHLGRVRFMFENATVLIFTLGLTESWAHAELGHTYPACPGTVRGQYDTRVHVFRNFSCSEVLSDLKALLDGLKKINNRLKIILTVSPVPLVATHSDHNVLVASSYSKSVLRAAAGEIEATYPNVDYFPSYEIINHPASFGQYLASDLREVTDRGVSHVMQCFLSSYFNFPSTGAPSPAFAVPTQAKRPSYERNTQPLIECEELLNEPKKSEPNIDAP